LLTTQINVPSYTSITIEGEITATADIDVFYAFQETNIEITGGKITGFASGNGILINFNQTSYSSVENVVMKGGYWGVLADAYDYGLGSPQPAQWNTIINNEFIDQRHKGILLSGGATNTTIQENFLHTNNITYMLISISTNNTHNNVIGNIGYGAKDYGIQLREANHTTVVGNVMEITNTGGTGITLEGSAGAGVEGNYFNTISANVIPNCGGVGLMVAESSNNSICNNVVENAVDVGLKLVVVGGIGSNHNLIVGNTLVNNKYGIYGENGSDYNIIIGANTQGSTTDGIIFVGGIANNHVNLSWNATAWIA